MRPFSRSLLLALLLFTSAPAAHAVPLGDGFTYQGLLQQAGLPANGAYDFRFRQFTALLGGSQVAGDVLVNDLAVTNGVFTAPVDFGSFGSDARWIEVEVRDGASAGAYTTLTPRQPVTAAPVALYAKSGGTQYWSQQPGGLVNSGGPFVGINRSTPVSGQEQFGVHSNATVGYGGMYASMAGDGKPFYGFSTPSHTAWTHMDGASGSWFLHVGAERMICTQTGLVGIGTNTPTSRLDVFTVAGHAVEGTTTAASSYGVTGMGTRAGVHGTCPGTTGSGVLGTTSVNGGTGVRGEGFDGSSYGVAGYTTFGTGVYGTNGGSNTNGHAGYFSGRVHVAGNLSKASGSFLIDHPLDPANKTLSHSFVESPDMMNIYNGNAVTDDEGRATIAMPDWFDALNRDFRYQLTPLGEFAQVMVEREMTQRTFVIRTDKPNVRVSWQVTGIRQDAYAKVHPIVVEQDKGERRGRYLFPEGFAQHDAAPKRAEAARAKGGR